MLDLHAVVPSRGLDVELTVNPGETVALLGANGVGKSTLLAVIAGLIRPAVGHVRIGDRSVGQQPPHRRGVMMLSQDPLLFPHLNTLDNVAFGPRSRGASRAESRRVARARLDQLEMGAYARRRPRELSGGQAQRVAIARALAADPSILLLDEPFAAVDADSRPRLRHQVRRVLDDRIAIVVTHDILDALALASRVVVLEEGRIVEDGSTAEVFSRPRSAFAASLVGFNIIEGRWTGTAAATPVGELFGSTDEPLQPGDAVVVLIRPSAVAVFENPPAGSMRNHLSGPISRLEPLGDRIRVTVDLAGIAFSADITAAAVAELRLATGQVVTLAVKATEVTLLASRTTQTPVRR